MDWETEERMPRFDDIREFEVWIHGQTRTVKRVGNRSHFWTPGTLLYTDCSHPMQNVLCNEAEIEGWRVSASQHSPMAETA